jgi:hypothetical protein
MSRAAQGGSPQAHFPDRAGWVRRADVSLRAAYPNLMTRIFEVAPHNFVIVFDKALQDASAINFEEIRPIGLPARISNDFRSSICGRSSQFRTANSPAIMRVFHSRSFSCST